jgi:hypothetical protein
MLKCWYIQEWSSFFCLLQNLVSVGYGKLLVHVRYGGVSKCVATFGGGGDYADDEEYYYLAVYDAVWSCG